MPSVNKTIIIGHCGKDPSVNYAPSGDQVTNVSIATSDTWKDKNGEKREATWYDCALWGKRAEALAPYIAKGSKLALSGRPGCRAHEGKAYLALTVDGLTFMSSRTDGGSERETDKPAGPRESYDLNDDIPF